MPDRPNSWGQPGPLGTYSDAARRISDAVTLHLTVDPLGNEGRWLAFKLADGECDSTLYDTKNDAMRHKGVFAKNYGYAKLIPTGMPPAQAESYLKTCRQVSDNPRLRWRNSDPDAPVRATELMTLPMRKEFLR